MGGKITTSKNCTKIEKKKKHMHTGKRLEAQ
jgi:hypothetical protein